MKIQSTLIKQGAQGNAIVELFVSAVEEPGVTPSASKGLLDQRQADSAMESVLLRVSVPMNHNFLSGYQSDAIERAIEILESARNQLSSKKS